ncbi:MFS transporter [uncultured Jatrophihabitans sp.]|uniref:MFS transporter n=1 Tax=uncultured Jatrophihabitans sp. TaxID=1610747 RepID=UPI0035CB6E26
MTATQVTAPSGTTQPAAAPGPVDPSAVRHRQHRFSSPYALAVSLSLLALSPFIVLTTATQSVTELMARSLHASSTTLEVGSGLSNAGYALGAVVAADLAQRFVQRHLFLVYEAAFVVASALAGFAPNATVYLIGHVLQGMATGLLLVAALPPLILRFPPSRLPLTVGFVNIGLFGAIALGPFLGNVFADIGQWRWLFIAAAVLGALGWAAAWFGYEVWPPFNPELPVDKPVFPLAVAATFLPFLGSALAGKVGFGSPWFWGPITVGVLALVTLIGYEYRHRREPLMPVRALSSALPVSGTLGAMLGGGAFVAALSLITIAQRERGVPLLTAGLELLPLVAGVGVSSVLFRRYLTRAGLPLLAGSGLVAVIAGIGVALPVAWSASPAVCVPIASLLLGFGAGASVAPALFLAGLGVESQKIGRAFALIELMRSEAAFLIAPVLVVLAAHIGGLPGVREALVISLVIATSGLLLAVLVYVGSGTRPHRPDVLRWLGGEGQALHSPPLFARLRGLPVD